jgi:tetratricopeptide (TPR) repeat protein
LAVTPDLVFLNCCHLGRVSEGSSKLQAGAEGHFHQLAASLARQLIEDGVRAVVAAGWAVNDDDAAAFASRFYGELLGGSTLGDAARRARKEIYENSGETSNTWGAYQIYGDPGFTLPRVRGGNWASEPAPFVAERDVLDAIQWLLRSARMPKVDPEVIEEHVGALLDRARPEWREGEVAFRVGEVLREAGSRAKAVDFYRRAIGTFDGDVNMQAVEKFANQADRLAKDLHDAGKAKEARALVREAGAKLRNLVELSPTPERLALYGGHYKRQIQLSPTSGRVGQWISAGEKWYSESSRLYREHHGRADYYSLLNSVQFAWLAARRSGQLQDDLTDELAADVDSVEAAASLAYDPDVFWSRVSPADVALTRALLDDAVGTDHDKLVAMYSKVLETGTADECDSTINNILFLREALQEHQEAVASQLERLEKDLR